MINTQHYQNYIRLKAQAELATDMGSKALLIYQANTSKRLHDQQNKAITDQYFARLNPEPTSSEPTKPKAKKEKV